MFATQAQRWMYKHVAKPVFFAQDPEVVHDRMCALGNTLGKSSAGKGLARRLFAFEHPALEQEIFGITFRNPVGLAAGFDKNAELTQILPSVGFGFEEVGSITGEACEGNAKPRLWRMPKSQALRVYYGLKNDGAERIAERLSHAQFDMPIGVSIAKTNCATTVNQEAGIKDYAKDLRTLASIGDYVTVNISCPNAYGGQPFADPQSLDALLSALDQVEVCKPIFIKIKPDTTAAELDALVEVADKHRVHGFIVSNLTKSDSGVLPEEITKEQKGGISGKPTQERADSLIGHLYDTAGERYVVIGVGGIFTAEDAYKKICQGASLVQLATGMIFEGPQLIGEINKGLVRLLQKDGFENISEAVGSKRKKTR